MNIQFSQTISKENWTHFNRQFLNYKYKKRLRIFFSLGVISILFLFSSLFSIWSFFQQPAYFYLDMNFRTVLTYCPLYFFSAFLFLIVAIEFFVLYRFQFDFIIKKALRNPKNASNFIQKNYTITDDQLEVTSEFVSSTFQWSSFIEVLETDSEIGLFINSSNVVLILKQDLMHDQLEQLKAVLSQKLGANYVAI